MTEFEKSLKRHYQLAKLKGLLQPVAPDEDEIASDRAIQREAERRGGAY